MRKAGAGPAFFISTLSTGDYAESESPNAFTAGCASGSCPGATDDSALTRNSTFQRIENFAVLFSPAVDNRASTSLVKLAIVCPALVAGEVVPSVAGTGAVVDSGVVESPTGASVTGESAGGRVITGGVAVGAGAGTAGVAGASPSAAVDV